MNQIDDKPALILIDIQKAFDVEERWGGDRNNPYAEQKSRQLLDYWRAHHLPIFHIQHCSVNPKALHAEGNPGNAFKDIVKPIQGEPIIKKSVNSAFIGTNLKDLLDKESIHTVVIVGLTTEHCVSTTTRMAGNYGYNTFIVSDATATFAKKGIDGEQYSGELMHKTALAHLKDEFASVVTTEELIGQLENSLLSAQSIK